MKIYLYLLFSFSVFAQDDLKGLEVARKIQASDAGWRNEQVESTMILRDANGQEVSRIMRSRFMEQKDQGDFSLLIFDSPLDVKGTALLTHSKKEGSDDQWIYLPALKRVKRISSSNRSGAFTGSEFSYEDISSQEIERFTYKYLSAEKCFEEILCDVFERYPVDENSGYTKQVVFADQKYFRIHRVDYYDRRGDLLKTLNFKEYQQYEKIWRSNLWEMQNHQNKKSTILSWRKREFKVGLTVSDFDQRALKRAR